MATATVPKKYRQDTGDRLLEHYAERYTQDYPEQAPDMPSARLLVDSHPGMQGLLGRGGSEKAYLKALVIAGIATDEEREAVDSPEWAGAWDAQRVERAVKLAADLVTATEVFEPAAADMEAKPKVGGHEWQGEVKNIPAARGYDLLARYRQAARALHMAKEEAKAVEAEIMEDLGGYEHGAVDGQQVFHWPWVPSTSFDSKRFKEDPERKALYEAYLVTKPTRRFRVDGTVGVD